MSMSGGFEGSFLGDASKLKDSDRLECGICWAVYDPAEARRDKSGSGCEISCTG